ncbi:MAG: hypothetical protein AAFP08_03230 [Bacteroidota bacterium]
MNKYLDIRHLYLMRNKGKDIRVIWSVKIPFAAKRETKLHNMFACSRYTLGKGWMTLESSCKIGIAKNAKQRERQVNNNRASGKTEWFKLNWLERLCVYGWMLWWWFQWFACQVVITFGLCYGVYKLLGHEVA